MELALTGRDGVASPGVYREPGASGNFPSGEAYIAPLEDGANGTAVIDGSMVGIGTLTEPMTVTIENGRLTRIEGADAQGPYAERLSVLFEQPENGTIAELGIGTNEAAKLCGIILEDEKLYGTVHIAFGTTPRSAASPKRTATSTASSSTPPSTSTTNASSARASSCSELATLRNRLGCSK